MNFENYKSRKKEFDLVKDIEGYLVPGQEKAFFTIAKNLPKKAIVVEIGSFKGKSTACISLASPNDTKIYSIDTFEGNNEDFSEGVQFFGGNFLSEFNKNIAKVNGLKKVKPVIGYSSIIAKKWNRKIDFLFIDGSHIYKDVLADFKNFYPWLKPGGIIAFHDVDKKFPGVFKVWQEEVSDNLLASTNIHTLCFGIKPKKDLSPVFARSKLKAMHDEITIPKVFVVIPVHNRISETIECLRSIKIQTYKNIHTIVVDDGSSDGTSKKIKTMFPKVEIIKGNGKWFWTKSMYEGVKKALSVAEENDYVLTMNNDCFFQKNYVSTLVEGNIKSPQTITGSLVVSAKNKLKVVDAGVLINWKYASIFGMADKVSDKIKFYTDRGVITDFDTLPGKGTLVPVSVFKKIGNFNFRLLPHYIADYEFFCRAKKAGFKLVICSKSILYNFREMTGSSHVPKHQTSLKEAFTILFGRKSKLNIIDHSIFLLLCCPKKYLWVNFKQVFQKLINYTLMVKPFYYIKIAIDVYNKSKYPIKLFLHNLPIRIYQSTPISKIAIFMHNFPIYFKQNKKIRKFFRYFGIRLSSTRNY